MPRDSSMFELYPWLRGSEAPERISGVEIGNRPPSEDAGPLFRLARLLGILAHVGTAEDSLLAPGIGKRSGRIFKIFRFQQRPNYLSEVCAPLISTLMCVSGEIQSRWFRDIYP